MGSICVFANDHPSNTDYTLNKPKMADSCDPSYMAGLQCIFIVGVPSHIQQYLVEISPNLAKNQIYPYLEMHRVGGKWLHLILQALALSILISMTQNLVVNF